MSSLLPNVESKSVKEYESVDMEIQDLLSDVNEFLWLYYLRPQWVLNKLRFCPHTLVQEDIDQTRTLLEKAADLDSLIKFRQLVRSFQSSEVNKQRLASLDRAIENVNKVKFILNKLICRIQAEIKKRQSQQPQP